MSFNLPLEYVIKAICLYVILSKLSSFSLPLEYVIKAICLYVILAKYLSFCLNYRHSVLLYSFTGIVTCSSVKSAFVACALTLKPKVRFFSLGKL